MAYRVNVRPHSWQLHKPFKISRDVHTTSDVVICEISDGEAMGQSEAVGVSYHGETAAGIIEQVAAVMPQIEADISRQALQEILPPGGARNLIDCALWDLEAKRTGKTVWQMIGWGPASGDDGLHRRHRRGREICAGTRQRTATIRSSR